MLIKSKNILAVEISSCGINIIEGVRSSKQPKIINYVQINNLPQSSELIAQKIAEALKEKGIKTKAAHLVVYDPQIEQHHMQVPNLSKKELQQVVKREMGKRKEALRCELKPDAKDSEKKVCEQYSDYQIMGGTEAQKGRKKDLLLAFALQPLIDDYAHLMETAGLEPRSITSVPLVLANSLNFIAPAAKNTGGEQDNAGFLYLMPDKGLLVVVSQGIWHLFREIPLQHISPGDPPINSRNIDYQQLILELTRSFYYFNQQERGKQVSRLVVGSAWEIEEDIIKYLTEGLQIPVSLFNPADKLNIEGITPPPGGWPPFLNSMPVPLGLLAESNLHISINLLPLKVQSHKQRIAGKFLIGLGVLIYAVSAVGGYMGLRWAQENYRRALENEERNLQPLRPVFKHNQDIEKERRRRDFQLSILKNFERVSPLWRGAFYELSRLVPSGLILSSIEIAEVDKHWEMKTEGVIRADTSMRAQEILKVFFDHLGEAVFFSRPRIVSINLAPYQHNEAMENLKTSSVSGQVVLSFSLTCNIRC